MSTQEENGQSFFAWQQLERLTYGEAILWVVARLADGLQRLHEYRRNEREALEPILRRLVAIERALGLREKIEAPRATRRRPFGA